MKKAAVFYAIPGENEFKRIAYLVVNEQGRADLSILDNRYADRLNDLYEGVAPRSLKRTVTPEEGELYIAALLELFSRSSYWRVAEDAK